MRTSMLSISRTFATGILMSGLILAASGQDKAGAQDKAPRYKDASLPIENRVADLLPRMTLEEKVFQLTGGWDGQVDVVAPTGTFTNEKARKPLAAEWGTELKFTPRDAAILRNGVQRYLKEKSRLGIPAMFPGEGL